MRYTFTRLLLLVAFVAGVTTLSAQRNCGSMELLEQQIQQDPSRLERLNELEKFTRAFDPPQEATKALTTIPVVVHIVYNGSTQNISLSQIQSQMQVLNDDFRRLNSDADNEWPQAADSEIEFCLATVDPNGNATDGIIRQSTTRTSFGTNNSVKSSGLRLPLLRHQRNGYRTVQPRPDDDPRGRPLPQPAPHLGRRQLQRR